MGLVNEDDNGVCYPNETLYFEEPDLISRFCNFMFELGVVCLIVYIILLACNFYARRRARPLNDSSSSDEFNDDDDDDQEDDYDDDDDDGYGFGLGESSSQELLDSDEDYSPRTSLLEMLLTRHVHRLRRTQSCGAVLPNMGKQKRLNEFTTEEPRELPLDLFRSQKDVLGYKDGGHKPISICDELGDNMVITKLGFGHFSTLWIMNN